MAGHDEIRTINDSCASCGSKQVVYRGIRHLCGSCFEDFLLKKFMRSMRVGNLQKDASVIVGISGGPCSTLMANLFSKSLRPRDSLRIKTVFVNDDDDAVPRHMQRDWFGWEHEEICIRGVTKPSDPDSRREWIRSHILSTLARVATESGSTTVLVGDCSEKMALEMLSCTARFGRGLGAIERCQPAVVLDGVRFIRPLHSITAEQVAAWIHYGGIECIEEEQDESHDSIYNLTKSFLAQLQTTFPSCISNIIRTTGKLIKDEGSARCDICKDPMLCGSHDKTICEACVRSGLHLIAADLEDNNSLDMR